MPMPTLPDKFTEIVMLFAVHFSPHVWQHARGLVIGAILVRGQRTVTAVLRVMGLSEDRSFENYHRVLNRAVWDARAVSRTLMMILIQTFAREGELLMGGDETIERRTGKLIRSKGIYRDPVRSSHSHFVKASGLRWVTVMLLRCVPFAQRIWALPFLTLLAPSERFYGQRRRHKKLTDWMRQALLQVRRWLPDRKIIFVGEIGCTQMTKTHQFARGRGGDDIVDLDIGIIDNDPINQQFNQPSFLLESCTGQASLNSSAKVFDA
jgi:hypothetical protein